MSDDTKPVSETIEGGRYINEHGFWINAHGEFIDKHGKVVKTPIKASEPEPKDEPASGDGHRVDDVELPRNDTPDTGEHESVARNPPGRPRKVG